VYGEVMAALYTACEFDGVTSRAMWDLQRGMVEFIETGWKQPDDGIWEVRGPRRHFTHSKVMAWVAVDRAVRTLEAWPTLKGPLEKWRALRDEIHAEVCAKGFSQEKQAFTQYYGSDQLDASLLMMPLVGFLPAQDPRVVATVEAIERELVEEGFVLRYRTTEDGSVDGLTGREGAFLACSFWLADCLHMIGRTDDANALFERLLALRNDLGLLSEEYDPVLKRQVGNFPQAFSHVSLVNTARRLSGQEMHIADGMATADCPPTVAALGAPLVSMGKATRHPWRMWGPGSLATDEQHPRGQRLHIRTRGVAPKSDENRDGAGGSRRKR
jgi:GH15 family glucan-1,4-alpha-glucosidase